MPTTPAEHEALSALKPDNAMSPSVRKGRLATQEEGSASPSVARKANVTTGFAFHNKLSKGGAKSSFQNALNQLARPKDEDILA